MKIIRAIRLGAQKRAAAFSLLEAVVGMAVIGVIFLALYGALASGFSVTQMARENLRATQILMEKAETFRLFTWDQITTSGWVPTTFSTTYSPTSAANSQGAVFSGKIAVTTPATGANYSSEMRQVDITVTWKTGAISRNRTLTLYVARNGIQNYVY